jgi:hypothetical protein
MASTAPTPAWPCPFTLPAGERPAWAEPPDNGPEDTLPCAFGQPGTTCFVPGCTCLSLDSDGLCEGHWLDTK